MSSLRVDQMLVARGLAPSRSAAQRLIEARAVWVSNQGEEPIAVTKSGLLVEQNTVLTVTSDAQLRYVSRAGLKLERALASFELSPLNCCVLDVGQSTGGFTDCLLRHGAAAVVGVDVGHSQLHTSLRDNLQVKWFERLNIRDPQTLVVLGDQALSMGFIDARYPFAVIDVSFVSLLKVLPAVRQLLSHQADCIALFKPQFEVGKQGLNKAGIVRNEALTNEARLAFVDGLCSVGFALKATVDSPISGSDGNREFLYHLKTIDHKS